jgi:hypothetical protein
VAGAAPASAAAARAAPSAAAQIHYGLRGQLQRRRGQWRGPARPAVALGRPAVQSPSPPTRRRRARASPNERQQQGCQSGHKTALASNPPSAPRRQSRARRSNKRRPRAQCRHLRPALPLPRAPAATTAPQFPPATDPAEPRDSHSLPPGHRRRDRRDSSPPRIRRWHHPPVWSPGR